MMIDEDDVMQVDSLDHVLGDDFGHSKYQKTSFICHISIG